MAKQRRKPSPPLTPAGGPHAPRDLPPPLMPLVDLALDLRWTWSHAGDALWRAVDAPTWEATRNPWFVLQNVTQRQLEKIASDSKFIDSLRRLNDEREAYLCASSWCTCHPARLDGDVVAYFSMEFGLGQAIPLYAGGLGILAGDYLKAASDLGLPLVGVGVLFQEGYFRQSIDGDGWQREVYPYNDPTTLPIQPLYAADGAWMRVSLELPGRTLWLRVWRARVGRVNLYLLDANDLLNSPTDRGITAKLYGGNPETRLLQEFVLGVGGWRLLEALSAGATIAHLNEGHAAFVVIERARSFMRREGVSFDEALWATRAGNVFTTHTPVAAGFDCFDPALIERIVLSQKDWFAELGISPGEFLALGRRSTGDGHEPFNMAYLAMRGCAFVNGVSRLHGEVSRTIFRGLFPRWPEREVPVDHVTNGIHVPSWDSGTADELWTQSCGKDRWRGSVEGHEPIIKAINDEALWALRAEQRRALVGYARRRLDRQLARRGLDTPGAEALGVLDPDALTLGFARRFAEYKRPGLLLRDPERLVRLLRSSDRPVQIVVAGKAHPADETGKRMIAEWIQFVNRPEVRLHAVFLDDYDIALAEELTQGVDVWINTPRRPWEACGTSGMKVLVNGGLNLSELDGWWAEAHSPEVGWALGAASGASQSDQRDAEQLYALLEREVVPEFYERDDRGLPRRWLERLRASMARLAPAFSANRMLREYLERIYVPAAAAHRRRTADGARIAKDLACWRAALESGWSGIRFGEVEARAVEGGWHFQVAVSLGDVPPDWIRVQLYADAVAAERASCLTLTQCSDHPEGAGELVFEGIVATPRPAADFTPRIVPYHAEARVPAELPLVTWR